MRLLGDLGPGVAAVLIVMREYGAQRLRALLAQLIPRSVRWTVAAVIVPAAIIIIVLICAGSRVNEVLTLVSLGRWVRVLGVNLPFAPFWEELGWRGYLLPELQATRKPLAASFVVGIIWGLWHIPLYLSVNIPGSPAGGFLLCFFVLTLGLSFLFSWVYNASKYSLATVVLLHASLNSSIVVFLGPAMVAAGIKPFLAVTTGFWLVTIVLLVSIGAGLSYDSRHAQV